MASVVEDGDHQDALVLEPEEGGIRKLVDDRPVGISVNDRKGQGPFAD
jgi:hypothetical protein